jgi:hypothetical protein
LFRWFIVAESTVRWFVVRENIARWLLILLNSSNEQGLHLLSKQFIETYSTPPRKLFVKPKKKNGSKELFQIEL